MFAKYKISIDDVRNINNRNKCSVSRLQYINNSLQDDSTDEIKLLLESGGGIIDGEKIKTEFFPTKFKEQYNVFISHSHGDIKEIEHFACVLNEKYGVRCFVDSMIWKNVADLQKEIDSKYSKNANGKLDYRLVRQSTAHIHSLLSIALFEMIDQCECCIFVQSDNSLRLDFNDTTTMSPWIYEEIFYMNHTKRVYPTRIPKEKLHSILTESNMVDRQIKMTHVVDLSKFRVLSLDYFKAYLTGAEFLNHIYWKSGLMDCSING